MIVTFSEDELVCFFVPWDEQFSLETACFGLYIDKICAPDVFSEIPLNTDTRIKQTLWHVPLVSLLTGFHCMEMKCQRWPQMPSTWGDLEP